MSHNYKNTIHGLKKLIKQKKVSGSRKSVGGGGGGE